jgi:hypothetical protein
VLLKFVVGSVVVVSDPRPRVATFSVMGPFF